MLVSSGGARAAGTTGSPEAVIASEGIDVKEAQRVTDGGHREPKGR